MKWEAPLDKLDKATTTTAERVENCQMSILNCNKFMLSFPELYLGF